MRFKADDGSEWEESGYGYRYRFRPDDELRSELLVISKIEPKEKTNAALASSPAVKAKAGSFYIAIEEILDIIDDKIKKALGK